MSDEPRETKTPSHIAYQVREGAEGKAYFNRVGSAFAHNDGKGFNLILDSLPVDGRVTLRAPQDRLADMGQDGAQRERRPGHRR